MKILLIIICGLFGVAQAQTTGYFRYDTTRFQKGGGNNEVIIENATRGVTGGVLTNTGGGRTAFVTPAAGGSTNTSIGAAGFKLNVDATNNINKLLPGWGMIGDSATTGQVGVRVDSNAVKALGFTAPSLQQVVDIGNRSDTNVLVKSVFTNTINSDSTHESDYEIVVLPDPQGMTYFNPTHLYSMGTWIKNNKVSKNIQAVLALGDLTDNSETYEWPRVDTLFKTIDSANVPYFPLIGNHDYDPGDWTVARTTTEYNTYFGTSRYTGKSWFGGAFNGKTENSYIKFDVGTTKYLVVGLEFLPTDSSLAWAGRVIDSFPDYKTIVITHAYLSSYGERSTDTTFLGGATYGGTADNSGQEMWTKLIKTRKSIFMVLNGHFIDNKPGDFAYSKSFSAIGDAGNTVQQIFVNYQRKGNGGGWNNAGAGYFMRMRFSPTNSKVYLSYYSSVTNAFDPLMDSFNIDVPDVEVNTSLSVKRNVLAGNDLKVNGNIYTSIPRYFIPFIGINGQLKDTAELYLMKTVLRVPNISVAGLAVAGQVPFVGSGDFRLRGSTKLFNDSANGRVGVGISTPLTSFHVTDGNGAYAPHSIYTMSVATTNSGDGGISLSHASNTFDSRSVLLLERIRGTQTTPLALVNGDWVGGIVGRAFNGISSATTASMEFIIDGAVSTGVMPQKITFQTGTGSLRSERMVIKANGNVGIGATIPLSKFHTVGTVRHESLGTTSSDTITNKPLGINSSGDIIPMTSWQGSGGGSSSLTVGTTAIAAGASGNPLYNNAGVLGEYTTTGTGITLVKSVSPTIATSLNVTGSGQIATLGNSNAATWQTLGLAGSGGNNAVFGSYSETATIGHNLYYNGASFVNPNAAGKHSAFLFQDGNTNLYSSGTSGGMGLGTVFFSVTAANETQIGGKLYVGGIGALANSTAQIAGSFATAYTSTAVSMTATIAHNVIAVSATGQTITLPTAVGVTGRIYTVKLTAAGTATVATTSSELIDGATTYSLASQYKYVTVQSTGSAWIVIANN